MHCLCEEWVGSGEQCLKNQPRNRVFVWAFLGCRVACCLDESVWGALISTLARHEMKHHQTTRPMSHHPPQASRSSSLTRCLQTLSFRRQCVLWQPVVCLEPDEPAVFIHFRVPGAAEAERNRSAEDPSRPATLRRAALEWRPAGAAPRRGRERQRERERAAPSAAGVSGPFSHFRLFSSDSRGEILVMLWTRHPPSHTTQ